MINSYHRCGICNRTDNEEAINDISEFAACSFVPDPNNPLFDICMECFEDIQDTLFEFDEEEIDPYEDLEE